jgi:addiction module HigA family antidote
MSKLLNVHPGELLHDEFLLPLGITANQLAKDARLPAQRVSAILKRCRGITAETDLHLCAYFSQAPGYWLRVQLAYDLRAAQHAKGDEIRATVRALPSV